MGAPLICDVQGLGKFQVGMFFNLGSSAEDRGPLADPREMCVTASEMRFALIINDRELIHKIDDYGVSGLIMAYATCGFM